jgi:hypothetical protein
MHGRIRLGLISFSKEEKTQQKNSPPGRAEKLAV